MTENVQTPGAGVSPPLEQVPAPRSPAPGRCLNPQPGTAAVPAGAGFTLLELLVTIAIIGVLAGLLLPTLARSKAAARRVQCVANLHQLGLAVQMYWDENGGAAFRYRGVATNGGLVYWFGWLGAGPEGTRSYDRTMGALAPHLSGKGVEVCPSLGYALSHFKLKARGASYGYGYNLQLSTPAAQPPVKIHELPRPTEVVVLADAAQVNTFQPPASPEHPMLEEFYYVNTNEPTAHFRHGRWANVLFGDGRAGAELPVAGSLDARLPREQVGFLRRDCLVLRPE